LYNICFIFTKILSRRFARVRDSTCSVAAVDVEPTFLTLCGATHPRSLILFVAGRVPNHVYFTHAEPPSSSSIPLLDSHWQHLSLSLTPSPSILSTNTATSVFDRTTYQDLLLPMGPRSRSSHRRPASRTAARIVMQSPPRGPRGAPSRPRKVVRTPQCRCARSGRRKRLRG